MKDYNNYPKTRMDILTSDLCSEIDMLRSEVEYWKAEAEHWQEEYNKLSNESLLTAKQGVADALMFALNVRDNPDGSLSIPKENREEIAKHYKTKLT